VARSDVATVRPEGPYPGRLRWYRALAAALAAGRPPAGAVFEASSSDPVPCVTVRPETLVASLRTAPAAGSVRLEPRPVPPPLEPPSGGPGRLGVVCPRPLPTEDGRADGPVPPELVSLEPFAGLGAWVGVQTFWLRRRGGPLDVTTRFRVVAGDARKLGQVADLAAARVLSDWTRATRTPADVVWVRPWRLGDWRRGGLRSVPPGAWQPFTEGCHLTAEVGLGDFRERTPPSGAHAVVFGASGAGKTTFLAARAARAISEGQGVVVLDLHGDLAPQVVERLDAADRARVVAIDASARPFPGVAGLAGGEASVDRAAAHFVAAVKRLSPDGSELAWGFRLERIFDTFARLVLERRGSLVDLYALLTDPDRREAARLATRHPATARFLDELGPILRRDPEFLWSAATRLSKVVLVPGLVDLLAPPDGGLEVEALLAQGRALLVRLPLAALGPESSTFAGTLLLGRLYLGLAARSELRALPRPVLVVLDEVQSLAPRMVAELLAEGRKFGVEALVATQYPDRLAPEVRGAAAGAVGTFVTFRMPAATAASVGPWVGLAPSAAAAILPGLPVGAGVTLGSDAAGLVPVECVERRPEDPAPAWKAALDATRREFDAMTREEELVPDELLVERLLLAVLAAEESGHRLAVGEVVSAAGGLPGEPAPAEQAELAWTSLLRGPELEVTSSGVRLTSAGERRLGLGRNTGASRETADHRALLIRAFRLFARRGYLLEILRQGRFDTTLPDALFRQLGRPTGGDPPALLAERIDRARSGWAWRFFGGRDVHVEAEVSGALRAERIRHGWAKAHARGAFVVFVVGDARRADRVRRTLRAMQLGPDRAQVWTLGPSGAPPNP